MPGLLRLMLLEEYRLHVSYSSRRMFFTMPLYIVLLTLFFGSTFSMLGGSITMSDMVFMSHGGMFIYGISVGAFGFLGRTYIERRYGKVNFLVAMPFLLPISFKKVYLGMFVRDIIFYSVLILLPAYIGLCMSTIVAHYSLVSITLLFLALFISFILGISFSFMVSVLYTRSLALFGAVVGTFISLLIGYGYLDLFPLEALLPSVGFQLSVRPFGSDPGGAALYALASLVMFAIFTVLALALVRTEYESKHAKYKDRYKAYLARFRPFRSYDSLVAKEFIDIARSGMASKMMFAYIAPLMFLSISTWYINTGLNIPVGFNIVFYAGMVGFFGVMLYNWLTNIDLHDYYETLPLNVPMVIRAKLIAYFLLTVVVATAFVLGIAVMNGETRLLWVALPVLYTSTIYMVIATAYLTGLRTSAFLFDPGVMGKFAAIAMLPDIAITILSFSIDSDPFISLTGITVACMILLGATLYFHRKMDRKWASYAFT